MCFNFLCLFWSFALEELDGNNKIQINLLNFKSSEVVKTTLTKQLVASSISKSTVLHTGGGNTNSQLGVLTLGKKESCPSCYLVVRALCLDSWGSEFKPNSHGLPLRVLWMDACHIFIFVFPHIFKVLPTFAWHWNGNILLSNSAFHF